MDPLQELLAGNARARAAGRAVPPAGERRPIAAVLTCTDERVIPQEILDQPAGNLYMVRVAGAVCTDEVAGSLEIAALRLGAPLVVVLGHTDCTAVAMSSSSGWFEGHSFEICRRIREAIQDVPPEAPAARRVEANVRHSILRLRESSRILSDLEARGQVRLAGAVYEMETGAVRRVC